MRFDGRPQDIIAGPNFAHLAIPRADGTVHAVIVWAHAEGGSIFLNSAEHRRWPHHLRRARTGTLTVMADGNPRDWVSVICRLVDDTHHGADEHIRMLARKYLGVDRYELGPDEQRITFTLAPERVYSVSIGA